MTWKTDNGLSTNLSWRISTAYWRNLKSGLEINLLGNSISAIDPLFLDPNCSHVEKCDSNNVKAVKYESWPWPFKVESDGKQEIVNAEVRMSLFPPKFGSKDGINPPGTNNQNIRQKIMREYNGILFYRQGRFVDCVRHIPLGSKKDHRFQTYDMNYKIEVNFPSSLDEHFGISTNKQFVNFANNTVYSDGWVKLITECKLLYNKVKKNFEDLKIDNIKNAEAAVKAIDESDNILNRPENDPVAKQKKQRIEELAEKNLEKIIDLEVERRKKALEMNDEDIDKEKIRAEVTPQYVSSKRKFLYEDKDEHSPFFRIEPILGVRNYYINRSHNFYKKIWTNPLCTGFMKESLKLIMSAIGESSLGASDAARIWYYEEMSEWSRNLHVTSDKFIEKNQLEEEDFDDSLPN